MKANELSQLTYEELMDKYRKFKEELFHVRFQLATGQLEKTHRLQGLRRDLARVLTFLSQRQAPAPVAKPEPAVPAKAPKAPKAPRAPKPAAEKAAKPATTAAPKAKKAAAK